MTPDFRDSLINYNILQRDINYFFYFGKADRFYIQRKEKKEGIEKNK